MNNKSNVIVLLIGAVCCISQLQFAMAASGAQPSKAGSAHAVPAAADSGVDGQCKKLIESAKQALSTGMVGDAHSAMDQAIELLNNSAGDHSLQLANCYALLGKVQIAEGTQGLADDSLKRALDLRESKLGPKHETVLQSCTEYADLLDQLGRKDEAAKLRERVTLAHAAANAAAVGKVKPGSKSSNPAFDKLMDAAQKASAASKLDEAKADWKLAIAEAEKSGGKDGRLAFALVRLSDFYDKTSPEERDQATAFLKRGIEAREKAGAIDTMGMARNLQRLGAIYVIAKDYAGAESALQRAVEIAEKKPGNDEFIAMTLQSLVAAAMYNKHLSQCEQYCNRLSDLAAKNPESPTSAGKKSSATAMLMMIYQTTGNQDKYKEMYRQFVDHPPKALTVEQMKGLQTIYVEMDKAIDAGEQSSFK